MGGIAFSVNMVWAQIFPFVALQLYEGDTELLTTFLIGSFCLWFVANAVFFSTIDLSYIDTFFGTKTAAQYTTELYLHSETDDLKFDAVFSNRIEYTKSVHEDIKSWIATNIVRWKAENHTWFKIEMIPDHLLPAAVFIEEGGFSRRRSSVGVSITPKTSNNKQQVVPFN